MKKVMMILVMCCWSLSTAATTPRSDKFVFVLLNESFKPIVLAMRGGGRARPAPSRARPVQRSRPVPSQRSRPSNIQRRPSQARQYQSRQFQSQDLRQRPIQLPENRPIVKNPTPIDVGHVKKAHRVHRANQAVRYRTIHGRRWQYYTAGAVVVVGASCYVDDYGYGSIANNRCCIGGVCYTQFYFE